MILFLFILFIDECKYHKTRYEKEMENFMQMNNEIENSKIEMKMIVCEKISFENKYSVDHLIDLLNLDINQSNNEKQKVINDFIAKKLSFEAFVEAYKQQSIKYHSLLITKDKLYQVKMFQDQI